MDDVINRKDAIGAILSVEPIAELSDGDAVIRVSAANYVLGNLPSAQPDIAEKLYLCKCYVTDEEGLQHEVIHTGDIRRITGWEI